MMQTKPMAQVRQLAGSLLLSGLLAGCSSKGGTVPTMVYSGPLMETTNVLTLFSDSAKLKFKLTAPLEQQFENGDFIYPKGMTVSLFSPDGKQVVNTLTARYGKVDKVKNIYVMRGDVRVVNVPDQQRLNTEELFYDKSKGQIYTKPETDVTVTTPTERLLGKGLTANENFSRYRILTPTGIFALENAP